MNGSQLEIVDMIEDMKYRFLNYGKSPKEIICGRDFCGLIGNPSNIAGIPVSIDSAISDYTICMR